MTTNLPGLTAHDYELTERGDRLEVSLMYPRIEGKKITRVEVDLCCVRAAYSIIVGYCHQRDAWVISRIITHGYNEHGESIDEEVELSLIPSRTGDDDLAVRRLIGGSDGE